MKKITYLILLMLFALIGCNSDNEDSTVLKQMYIDISDFTMYRGAPGGAVEVNFNNLKKRDLVNRYLSKVYNPNEYSFFTMQFNDEKLRYVESTNGRTGRQIISNYAYISDSLYIYVRDTVKAIDTLKFVALVDNNNNLFRHKGLCRYPYPEKEDTVRSFNERLNLARMLELSGHNNLKNMTDPKDTIAWCNVRYLFY